MSALPKTHSIRLDRERSLVQLGYGCHQKRVWATVTSDTSDVAVDLAADKEMTNRVLEDVGIPVPRSQVRPGDLVFPHAGHVQLAIGHNLVVEAPYSGASVRISPLGSDVAIRRPL